MSVIAADRHPPTAWSTLSPIGLVRNLLSHRDLIGQLTRRFVLERTRGSVLGFGWNLVTPLLMLTVFTFVFSVVWKARWSDAVPESHGVFALRVFAGLIVMEVVAGVLGGAPQLVTGNPNYVKKVVFPLEVLPVALVGALSVSALVGLAVLLAGTLVIRGTVPATAALFPVVVGPPLLLLSLGLAWALAALGVFVRDTRHVVGGVFPIVLMYLTPVFYPMERLPEPFRSIIALNPLSGVVEAGRAVLWGAMPDWASVGRVTLVGAAAAQLGYALFVRSKRGFADVI